MNEEGIPEIILLARSKGKRGIGRPKMRWLDSIDQDSERTEERKAINRDKWYKLLRKVRAQPGNRAYYYYYYYYYYCDDDSATGVMLHRMGHGKKTLNNLLDENCNKWILVYF